MHKTERKIVGITYYSSEACNLNCSYCEIAKSIEGKKENYEKNQVIKENLLNGNFLKNTLDTCKILKINPSDIEMFELWGQEPSLTIAEFAESFPSLYNNFHNLHKLFFSTNLVDTSNIYKLAEAINRSVNNKFELEIQCSYDGEFSTKNYRGIEPQLLVNNIKKLIEDLNNINFNDNIIVSLHFHNVVSRGLIKALNTEDKILTFWQEFLDLREEFRNLNNNKQVIIGDFSPGIENPVNASKEEGIEYYKFLKTTEKLCLEHKLFEYKGLLGVNLKIFESVGFLLADKLPGNFKGRKGAIEKAQKILFENTLKPFDLIHNFLCGLFVENNKFDENEYKDIIDYLSNHLYCGSYGGTLKLRYDGTMVYCQNVIHNFNEINNKPNRSIKNINLNTLIEHNFFPNVLEPGGIDDYEQALYKLKIMRQDAFIKTFCKTVNLMYLLAAAEQIDSSYNNDFKKILRHAFYITFSTNCMDTVYKTTGTLCGGQTAGQIRFYANGYLDMVDNLFLEEQQKYQETKTCNMFSNKE